MNDVYHGLCPDMKICNKEGSSPPSDYNIIITVLSGRAYNTESIINYLIDNTIIYYLLHNYYLHPSF